MIFLFFFVPPPQLPYPIRSVVKQLKRSATIFRQVRIVGTVSPP